MKASKLHVWLATAAAIAATGACNKAAKTDNASATNASASLAASNSTAESDPVASAESAAPAAIAHNASIVSVGADGKMTTLREGKNDWTCMPDAPDTPGPDPMCMDGNAAKWAGAWIGHKSPPPRARSG